MYIKVNRKLCAQLKDVMLRSSRRRFTSLRAGSLVRVGKKFIGSGVASARARRVGQGMCCPELAQVSLLAG